MIKRAVVKKHKRVLFDVGDKVVLETKSFRNQIGLILKLNPKNAVVKFDDTVWNVPYIMLEHESDTIKQQRIHRISRIQEVENQARELMNRYGLNDWVLEFNDARRQLGACKYSTRNIVLSRVLVLNHSPEQITDVILHEIAHAIAGWEAGHGPKWKAICEQLGARPISYASPSPAMKKDLEIAKEAIKVGDIVEFVDKKGQSHQGVALRTNIKTVTVKTPMAVWRVPYLMLKVKE
ncbi:MAG: SprT-like domain-containing protein [Bacteroidetes bacterium]|nr:SprT-like domain-containing protein [Bacteroidota bacterium]MCY4233364.1 SprT-like domain-containing protein [Bacteroidota bacterium]